jgi:SAM-dependent methyltransferase
MMRLTTALPPVLVITARLRNMLLPWYSRRHAQGYEGKRQGKRWLAEAKAFRSLYDRVNPKRVLDCPVGTGRWFDVYQEHGAAVTGIDLSNDMLAEAAKKAAPETKIVLKQDDLLAPKGSELKVAYDLIVCTRFVHWLRLADVARLIARFSATESRFLILGARVRITAPNARSRKRSLFGWLKQARFFSHVHDEDALLAILNERGWALVERARIGRGGSWSYFFYLLHRKGRPSTLI